jgi:hypothetical protein
MSSYPVATQSAHPPAKPYLSVIISSGQRQEFILSALESIAKQSLPRDWYEILVCRSFENEELDRRMRAAGATLIGNPSTEWGPNAAAALRVARGTVTSFLDDDDQFEPDKLARVWQAFSDDAALVYFHNSLSWMDVQGAPLPGDRFRQPTSRITCEGLSQLTLRRVRRFNGDMNDSSISVRTSAFLPALPWLERIRANHDRFIFVAAARTGGRLLFDPTKSTRYRVHEGVSQLMQHAPAGDPRVRRFWQDQIDANREIRAMLVGHSGSQWLAGDLASSEAQAVLAEGRRSRVDPRIVAALLASSNSQNLVQNSLLALSMVACLIAPRWTREAYSHIRYQPSALRLAHRL